MTSYEWSVLSKPCSRYWWRNPFLSSSSACLFARKGGWFQLIESISSHLKPESPHCIELWPNTGNTDPCSHPWHRITIMTFTFTHKVQGEILSITNKFRVHPLTSRCRCVSTVIEYEHSTSLRPACACRDECSTRKVDINWSAVQSSKCAPCSWITRTRISGINHRSVFCFHYHVHMKIRNEQRSPKTLYMWVRIVKWAIAYDQPFVGFFFLCWARDFSLRHAPRPPVKRPPGFILTGTGCCFSAVQRQERDANHWPTYWPSTKIRMLEQYFHFPFDYKVFLFRKEATFPYYCRQCALFTHWWIRNSHLIFVVPCIMLCGEIIPTRCNNCCLFFTNALLYMFWVTIPPIIRSTCAVYGHR